MIAGVWAEVLGLDRVGINDNLHDLGGHSLDATRIVSRLSSTLGVDLSLGTIFERPTIAELSAYIEQARLVGAGLQPPPLVPVPRDQDLPPVSYTHLDVYKRQDNACQHPLIGIFIDFVAE